MNFLTLQELNGDDGSYIVVVVEDHFLGEAFSFEANLLNKFFLTKSVIL